MGKLNVIVNDGINEEITRRTGDHVLLVVEGLSFHRCPLLLYAVLFKV